MRILHFSNQQSLVEREINATLKKLKHEVITVDDQLYDIKKVALQADECDIFLFHTGGVFTHTSLAFHSTMQELINLLGGIKKAKKVMWFPHKIWGLSYQTVPNIIPFTDYVFLNDDTWVRRHKYPNTLTLHMGTSDTKQGIFNKEKFDCDIAFAGSVYGPRNTVMDSLKEIYGNRFKIFNDAFGKDFRDLCASSKIMFEPKYPIDDFYWTDRIYRTLGVGGLVIMPRLEGLKEEGLKDGEHFLGYSGWEELKALIDFFVDSNHQKERDAIARQGRNYAIEHFTYEHRIKYLLSKVA